MTGKPFADRAGLRRIVAAATAAPSVHNTQPWHFRRLDGHTLELYAAPDRLLPVIDPYGRGLRISCGAALCNLSLAVRMTGHRARVLPQPVPDDEPDLLAVVRTGEAGPPDERERLLHAMIPLRRTNRFPFDGHPLPRQVLLDLAGAAQTEGATLIMVDGRTARRVLDQVAVADRALAAQPDYQAELLRWTGPGRSDGVPPYAFGPRPADDGTMPLRDFGLRHTQGRRKHAHFEARPQIAVLFTQGDGPRDWLRAGRALQRVLLTATTHGVSASLLSQPLDLRPARHDPASARPYGHVQMLIRLGYGPPVRRTPRRPVPDVLELNDR